MKVELHWDALHFRHASIPASYVAHGEHVRLVINRSCQHAFIQQMYSQNKQWDIWLKTAYSEYHKGSKDFNRRVNTMIANHGLIANLSMRENLLLPFLYHGNHQQQEQAKDEVETVARKIGLIDQLDKTIREHQALTDALISLGRCLLLKPEIIVAQEVHLGIPPEHLEAFEEISIQSIQQLGSGLLYLTSADCGGYSLDYARTLISKKSDLQENQ